MNTLLFIYCLTFLAIPAACLYVSSEILSGSSCKLNKHVETQITETVG